MELNKVTAAFFRRFDASIDPSMRPEEMRMYDTFNAAPAGGRLLLRLKEADE
jgi:benzoate 4-monooxygenase